MTNARHQQDKRSEVRYRAPADRVSWTGETATRTVAGWVSNVATSGIAFVTPTREQPAPGETIEVTFGAGGPTPQHRTVRVAHTAPYDRFFSVVGCRNEPAEKVTNAV